MENSQLEFYETRNFNQKMNATYGFIREHFKPLAKSLLLLAGTPAIIGSILMMDSISSLGQTGGTNVPIGIAGLYNQWNIVEILAMCLFMLLSGVFTIATTYGYLLAYKEKKSNTIEVSEVWQQVRKIFWINFGTMFGYFFSVIVCVIILIIPLGIIISVLSIFPVLVAIAAVAFYLGIFFVTINLSMLFFIRSHERIGFFASISRLFRLNEGNWWRSFGIAGLNIYIQMVFSILLFIPGYVIILLKMMHNTGVEHIEKPSLVMDIIANISMILYSLAGTLLYAIPLIALAFQYFNLIELKEARGLRSRIETFGEKTESTEDHVEF
ncbi:MAG TPA: hypothetical protein PLJ60_06775 [Chryseolinea sp.]|nr:hypothetical protein [Chryseolinea sp.]HPM30022.1 hypothetical protein [Chryseolinea sp.]